MKHEFSKIAVGCRFTEATEFINFHFVSVQENKASE